MGSCFHPSSLEYFFGSSCYIIHKFSLYAFFLSRFNYLTTFLRKLHFKFQPRLSPTAAEKRQLGSGVRVFGVHFELMHMSMVARVRDDTLAAKWAHVTGDRPDPGCRPSSAREPPSLSFMLDIRPPRGRKPLNCATTSHLEGESAH